MPCTNHHPSPLDRRRTGAGAVRRIGALALGATLVLSAASLSACGSGNDSKSRLVTPPPTVTAAPIVPDTSGEKPVGIPDPEAYGLPPLTTLQANPAGVAKVLLDRSAQTTWTQTWKVNVGGAAIGTILLEHLPAGGVDIDEAQQAQAAGKAPPTTAAGASTSAKLHVAGSLRAGEKLYQLDILDAGDGPRVCVSDEKGTWACNIAQLNLALQFLSLDGLKNLGGLLRQLLALPGVSVQYLKIADAPSACFFFPPAPNLAAQGNTLGIDLANGGSYCLSREGALTRLQVGGLDIHAVGYRKGADPAKFVQPV